MKFWNFFLERKDYRFLYEEANCIIGEQNERLCARDAECARLLNKAFDLECEITRLNLELAEAKAEADELKYYISKKNLSTPDLLYDIADKWQEMEVKAEKYDKSAECRRARDKRYRERLKAERQ